MKPVVLAVENERSILELISYNLAKSGMRVITAATGREALILMESMSIDLMVVDMWLPDVSGLSLCRRFRRLSRAPVLVLGALFDESDWVLTLEAGADDVIAKPFSTREFVARVRAHLRRWFWQDVEKDQADEVVQVGDLELNLATRRAYFEGDELHLTPTEFGILGVLCKARGRVISRERLLALATGQEVVGSARTVDVHVRALRLKLKDDVANPRLLETVRGAGYAIGRRLREKSMA